jgi:hypothetical protein
MTMITAKFACRGGVMIRIAAHATDSEWARNSGRPRVGCERGFGRVATHYDPSLRVIQQEHPAGSRAGDWSMSDFNVRRNAEVQSLQQNYGEDPLADREDISYFYPPAIPEVSRIGLISATSDLRGEKGPCDDFEHDPRLERGAERTHVNPV